MPKTATAENVIALEVRPDPAKLLVLLGPQNSGKSLLGQPALAVLCWPVCANPLIP